MSNKLKKPVKVIDLSKMSREELEKGYMDLYTRCAVAEAKADRFLDEYRLAQARRFGKSSEKGIVGQMTIAEYMKGETTSSTDLANESAANDTTNDVDDEVELKELVEKATGTGKKEKKKGGAISKKNLDNLKVEVVEFKLSEEEQVCPNCGSPLESIGKTERRELEIDPPKVHVKEYVTETYVCRNCEANGEGKDAFFKKEGAPTQPLFYNSPVAPSVVADCIHKKYVMALPFDRIAKDYKRQGSPITKDNMCKWSMKAAERFFKPIVDHLHEILMGEAAIHCDETYTQVIEKNKKSYVWVMTTAEYQKEHPIMLYNYRDGRSDADARAVLAGYHGYVMCDGYGCYTSVLKENKKTGAPAMDIKPVACMVHVKREFVDALKSVPKDKWGQTGAYLAVAKLEKIFHIDNKIEFSTYEERKQKRMGDLYHAMKDFFDYIRAEQWESLSSTKYGKAITYALNQEEKAMRLFEDGRLELDNNMAERTVKPYVINRKNSLFNFTEDGADASCILFSIVETAKQNHLDVQKYLEWVMNECRGMHEGDVIPKEIIEKLLPWSKEIPDEIKAPSNC